MSGYECSVGVFCDKNFLEEMQHTCLLIPDTDSIADQSTDTTAVQFDEPVSFVGVVCRDMGKGLCKGAEIIQRELYHQRPPQHEL